MMLKSRILKWITFSVIINIIAFVFPTKSENSGSVSALLAAFEKGIKKFYTQPPDKINLLPQYDFIIVGAGSAGCVLANRLSEITDWKVLLIEAGGEENYMMDIPIMAPFLQSTNADWQYKTEPSDKYCSIFKNNQCHWPRGKVLGGTSVLNFMIYTRGSQADYDNWKTMGNDGWGWDDVLPYFKKVENFNIPAYYDSEYHNKGGAINVEYSPYRTKTAKEWIKAAKELGFKYGDYNGAEPSGLSYLQSSLKDGVRQSSNKAYLQPIKSRSNLHVSKNSFVTKLIFDDANTTVIGVELRIDDEFHSILASKEVIVSAGAINSPQLLMLSGIGPKDHLDSLKIKVVKDLPVGHNLMDHVGSGGVHFLIDSPTISLNYEDNSLNTLFQWMENRKSPLSIPGACETALFMNLKDKFNTSLWPDFEMVTLTTGLNLLPEFMTSMGLEKRLFEELLKGPLNTTNSFLIFPILLRPKSKGRLLLKSRNPNEHPKLIPNYFENEEDLQKIVDGIKIGIEISKQPAMKKLGAKLYTTPVKDCLKDGDFGSDAFFACYTRKFTFSIYHQSGTCKMGAENDPTAVVGSRLKVHGIQKLRVIDASIMPEIVAAHTNAPTYMIAEKGADMIKQDWGRIDKQ